MQVKFRFSVWSGNSYDYLGFPANGGVGFSVTFSLPSLFISFYLFGSLLLLSRDLESLQLWKNVLLLICVGTYPFTYLFSYFSTSFFFLIFIYVFIYLFSLFDLYILQLISLFCFVCLLLPFVIYLFIYLSIYLTCILFLIRIIRCFSSFIYFFPYLFL